MPDEQSVSLEDVDRLRRPFRGIAGKLVIAGWGLYLLSMFLPAVDELLGLHVAILGAIGLLNPSPFYHELRMGYSAVILGDIANLLMLASPWFMIRKSRLGLWISSALMILPTLYIAAIPIILEGEFRGYLIGYYVWWLSFGVVAGGLVTRSAMHPASAPPFSLPRFSLRTLILFTVAFGTYVAAFSRLNSGLPWDKLTTLAVLMALAALAALIGSIVADRRQLR